MEPKTLGYCTTTQAVSASMRAMMSSMPFGIGVERVDLSAAVAAQRLDDGAVVRVQAAGEHGLLAARDAVRHQHGLGGGGGAVVHGGVGDLHAGEQRDLGLELEQILQRALRDLGLVGRVAGQEFRALDQVIDARRHVMAVGAGADEERHGAGGRVARGQAAELALDLQLALGLAAGWGGP